MVEQRLFELVVPCFNEAESLPALLRKTVESALSVGLSSASFQLILVNNGSTDKTQDVLLDLKKSDLGKWFTVLNLKENVGYGGGIYIGLKAAQAPWVGFTHADLQCEPGDAFRAFSKCREVNISTIVKGKRRSRHWLDWGVSRVFELCVGIIWGFWCFDMNAQPKVFSKSLIQSLGESPQGISFDAFVLWTAKKKRFQKKEIPVVLGARAHGSSHWNHGIKKRVLTFARVLSELLKQRVTAQSP